LAVLSNRALVAALDAGRLVIDPRPEPDPGERDTPYNTISVDLRLGPELFLPAAGQGLAFDIRNEALVQTLRRVYERREIGEGWTLAPNEFALGSTLERIELPLSGACLAARVEGRSSLARTGLLVHFTAPTIHPGFSGTIALEMINLGKIPLTLRSGLRVCQLIVETVEGEPIRTDSQFQDQQQATG
jgi:dCTP deaminase